MGPDRLGAMTAAEVIRAAMELSPAEREDVARTLLDSVDDGDADQDEVDASWKSVVSSRINEIRRGEVDGLTRDEVKAFLAARRAARDV